MVPRLDYSLQKWTELMHNTGCRGGTASPSMMRKSANYTEKGCSGRIRWDGAGEQSKESKYFCSCIFNYVIIVYQV